LNKNNTACRKIRQGQNELVIYIVGTCNSAIDNWYVIRKDLVLAKSSDEGQSLSRSYLKSRKWYTFWFRKKRQWIV